VVRRSRIAGKPFAAALSFDNARLTKAPFSTMRRTPFILLNESLLLSPSRLEP